MGWRYLLFSLGVLTLLLWGFRILLFRMVESPRYLVGRGQDAEAVVVIHMIAAYNGKQSNFTADHLSVAVTSVDGKAEEKGKTLLSRTSYFSVDRIRTLFRTRKLAFSTSLLISLWCESTYI